MSDNDNRWRDKKEFLDGCLRCLEMVAADKLANGNYLENELIHFKLHPGWASWDVLRGKARSKNWKFQNPSLAWADLIPLEPEPSETEHEPQIAEPFSETRTENSNSV